VGYYQMKGYSLVRYCYIPKALLRNPAFSLDEAFAALQMKTPDLVFELNAAEDVRTWNLRLPEEYQHLKIKEPFDPQEPEKNVSGYLQHYQVSNSLNIAVSQYVCCVVSD
jgi:hypothetical protein